MKVPLIWGGTAIAIAIPKPDAIGLPVGFLEWLMPLLAIAAVFGFVLSWVLASVAKRQDVNRPHPPGMLPFGEGATSAVSLVPVVLTTVAIFVFVIPVLAGNPDLLRGTMPRILAGVFAGFVVSAMTTRELFRCGRRPPPESKKWRFGEDPK